MILPITFCVLLLGVVSCSQGQSAPERVYGPAQPSAQPLPLPEKPPGNHSPFFGTWVNSSGAPGTLTIKRRKPGEVILQTETPQRLIEGYGHFRENELLAVRWYAWDVDPTRIGRQVFGAYWVDESGVLHSQSIEADGTLTFHNTFVRSGVE